jgi:hypothetical protein
MARITSLREERVRLDTISVEPECAPALNPGEGFLSGTKSEAGVVLDRHECPACFGIHIYHPSLGSIGISEFSCTPLINRAQVVSSGS